MTTLEKLQSDMEDDAYFSLSLEERYDLLKRDAETIAARLDAVVKMLEAENAHPYRRGELGTDDASRTPRIAGIHARAVAIAEGRTP